jgi:hypothetical protein
MRRALQALIGLVVLAGGLAFTASPAAASTCGITVGGHKGSYICEYDPLLVKWPDNHYQWFVVGTDYHVYDTYQLTSSSWSTWRSLGGTARSGVEVTYLTSSRITIRVVGTTGGYFCKTWRSSGDWGGWGSC